MEKLEIVFWASVAMVLYAYAGYPLLIAWVARGRGKVSNPRPARSQTRLPLVTVIIAAHNEERWIERKIKNTLALDYPRDRMKILVASDGSTDKTVEIASRFIPDGVRVIQYAERAGKMTTLNRMLPQADGDVLLYTDTNAMLEADALHWIIPHFADPDVGCVAGNRVCVATGSPSTQGEGLYWRYESWIKCSETRAGSCLGAYGQLFAARRSLVPLIPVAGDDFYIPMKILISTGARTVFEPRARARIPAAATLRQEFRRKVRSHTSLWWNMLPLRQGLTPGRSPIWWQFWSHHVFRLIVPWAALAALAISPWLWRAGPLYRGLVLCEGVFYVAAVAGLLLMLSGIRSRLLYVPFYFTFANLAVALSCIRRVQRRKPHSWPRTERVTPALASRKDAGTRLSDARGND